MCIIYRFCVVLYNLDLRTGIRWVQDAENITMKLFFQPYDATENGTAVVLSRQERKLLNGTAVAEKIALQCSTHLTTQ